MDRDSTLYRLLQMSNPALARELAKDPKKMKDIQQMEAEHIAVAAGSLIEDMIPGTKLRAIETPNGSESDQ